MGITGRWVGAADKTVASDPLRPRPNVRRVVAERVVAPHCRCARRVQDGCSGRRNDPICTALSLNRAWRLIQT